MYSRELRSIAREYGLHIQDEIAFGRCKGCFFSLTYEDTYWHFRIYIGSEQSIGSAALLENAWNAAAYIRWNTTDFIYNISNADPNDENSSLHILENGRIVELSMIGVNTRHNDSIPALRAFVENILPYIAEHTAPNVCACCGKPVRYSVKPFYMNQGPEREPDVFEPAFLPCGAVVPMHASCADSVRAASQEALQSHREKQRLWKRRQLKEFIILLLIGLIVLLWVGRK